MSQQLTESWISTNIPGAYANVQVITTPAGTGTSGIVTIIGEAAGGPSYLQDPKALKNNFYTPAQAALVAKKYLSGNIVDAMYALTAPSADANIQGAPTGVYIIKTNTGSQASSQIFNSDGLYGTLVDANYGVNGNSIKYQVTQTEAELVPTITSVTIQALATTNPTPQVQTIFTGAPASVSSILAGGGYFTITGGNGVGYYMWFKYNAIGTDPAPAGLTSLGFVNVAIGDLNSVVATAIAGLLNAVPLEFAAVVSPASTITVTNAINGPAAPIVTATSAPVSGLVSTVLIYGGTDPTLLDGDTFSIRVEGNAEQIVQLSASEINHNTIAALVIELNQYTFTVVAANATAGAIYSSNGQTFTVLATIAGGTTLRALGTDTPLAAPSTLTKVSGAGDASIAYTAVVRLLPEAIVASAGSAPATIALSMRPDPDNFALGFGKSFELVDFNPGDLAVLGFAPQLVVSASHSSIELNVVNQNTNTNEDLQVSGNIGFRIGYEGLTATLTINSGVLSTTVTGGSGASLVGVQLSQYPTIAALASYINSQPGYTAAATTNATQMSPLTLDQVFSIGIASTGAGDMPGQIKQAVYNFEQAVSTSGTVTFTPSAVVGLPAPMSGFVFLTGGALGGTANVDVLNALTLSEAVQTNFMIPLFSEDASLDIPQGLTDPTSTYTIDAINALFKTNVLSMSTPLLKHYRQATVSHEGLEADAVIAAQSLATYRCSLAFQKVNQTNSLGNVTLFAPWYAACIAAGMQAAGFYKGITNKYANIISFVDPADFNSGNSGSLEQALNAGLLILQQDTAGNKWISDQTTYGFDNNFVYNSMQAVYLSDIATLGLITGTQQTFVGQSIADVSAGAVKTYCQTLLANYKQLKIISASSDAPLGYKNLQVSIIGPVINISVELKLSTTIYFVAINISISQVTQTA